MADNNERDVNAMLDQLLEGKRPEEVVGQGGLLEDLTKRLLVEAENSMGFHADQEAMRVLGLSINYARLGTMALSGQDVPKPAPPPLPAPPRPVVPGQERRGRMGRIFEQRTDPNLRRPGVLEPEPGDGESPAGGGS